MNATTDFAATIGLDWADQKHDLWLRPSEGAKAEHLRLEQTPEALHQWVAKLRERFGNRRVALSIETSRGRSSRPSWPTTSSCSFPSTPRP